MQEKELKGVSYSSGFFILLGLGLLGLGIGSVASLFIWQQMTGKPFTEIETNLSNPAYANAIKILQAASE